MGVNVVATYFIILCVHRIIESGSECSEKIQGIKLNGIEFHLFPADTSESTNNTCITQATEMLPCFQEDRILNLNCKNICGSICQIPSSHATTSQSNISQSTTADPYTTSIASVAVPVPCNCTSMTATGEVALGIVIGLLVLALALVTIGWIWTCVVMNKWRRLKVNSGNNRYTDMDVICGGYLHTLNGTQRENENQESSTTVNTGETYEVITPLLYETVTIHAKSVTLDGRELSHVQQQTEEGGAARTPEATPEEDTGEQDCSNSQQDVHNLCENGHNDYALEPTCTYLQL